MYEYLLKIHANCYKTFLVFRMRLLYFIRNDGLYFVIARRYDGAICYLERDCFISFAMTAFTSSLRGGMTGQSATSKEIASFHWQCRPLLRHCEEVRRGNLLFRKRLLHFIRNDGLYFVIARRYDGAICYLERDCFISFAMTAFTSSLRGGTTGQSAI